MGIHDDGDVLTEEVGEPGKAVVLLHGRGAIAASFLGSVRELVDDAVLIAPQAHQRTWYPSSFMEPREQNQPWLDAALERVAGMLDRAADAGCDPDSAHLIGFSQGACLATEFAAANARRYGSVTALSGGLIGEAVEQHRYDGDMGGTPVFLGCSDTDPHIPEQRVHETAAVFEGLGADVDERIYPGMGHTVNEDEREYIRGLLG